MAMRGPEDMTFQAACMTPEESRLWEAAARTVRNGGQYPCLDCSRPFAAEMRGIGRCNGSPAFAGGVEALRRRIAQRARRDDEQRRALRYARVKRYRASLRVAVESVRLARVSNA